MRVGELEHLARSTALTAHNGQVDRAGVPYSAHLGRVAEAVHHLGAGYVAAAWLHDVVEDGHLTLADLEGLGLPDGVVAAVEALTHRPGEPYADYVARCAADPIARRVKIADLTDNLAPERAAGRPPDKAEVYRRALLYLAGS